ncbi:MAG: hypothetical protein ACRD8Z_20970, partial [Nitrososphaeraceae archaeon]
IQHVRFGAITALLILTTVTLIPSDISQTLVFAQNSTSTLDSTPITPAPKSSESGDGGSSSNNDDGNNDNNENGNNESSGSSGSDDDDSDSQDDTSSSEEEEAEDDTEQTNPLLDQIRNNVNGALSASGIPVQ